MRVWLPIVLVSLVSGVGAAKTLTDAEKKKRILELYAGYKKELGKFPEVSVNRLVQMRKRGDRVVLVDARESREQKVSIIKGAISARALAKHTRHHKTKVVVYCTIGYRSAELVKKLRKRGVNAFNLVGSILMWTHHGQPLHQGDRATKRLHVYGRDWDLAKSGIQTVY